MKSRASRTPWAIAALLSVFLMGHAAHAAVTVAGLSLRLSTGADGRVTYPALASGSWQYTVTASGLESTTASVTLAPGVLRITTVALMSPDTTDASRNRLLRARKGHRPGRSGAAESYPRRARPGKWNRSIEVAVVARGR